MTQQSRADIAGLSAIKAQTSPGGYPAGGQRKRGFGGRRLALAKPSDRHGSDDDEKDHHHDGGQKRSELVSRRSGHAGTVTVS
jgi:hypothetical protein